MARYERVNAFCDVLVVGPDRRGSPPRGPRPMLAPM
jgi:hypothetical protein